MKKILVLPLSIILSTGAIAADYIAGPSGGHGGYNFDDSPINYSQLHTVKLCGGSLVDSIQATYRATTSQGYSVAFYNKHGGTGGTCNMLYFSDNEYITSISGSYGSRVNSLSITTNKGQHISVGGYGPAAFSYPGSATNEIIGFSGRAGGGIDAIGVVYRN